MTDIWVQKQESDRRLEKTVQWWASWFGLLTRYYLGDD